MVFGTSMETASGSFRAAVASSFLSVGLSPSRPDPSTTFSDCSGSQLEMVAIAQSLSLRCGAPPKRRQQALCVRAVASPVGETLFGCSNKTTFTRPSTEPREPLACLCKGAGCFAIAARAPPATALPPATASSLKHRLVLLSYVGPSPTPTPAFKVPTSIEEVDNGKILGFGG